MIKSVKVNEGLGAFYKGISAAWIAEAIYYGLQLGLYEPIKEVLGVAGGDSFLKKLLAGAFAGMFGAVTGNPFVIIRTRMMVNKGKKKNIWLFVRDVLNEEGVTGFFKGFSAMFFRAIVLSSTKMAVYDTCKVYIKNRFML